MSNGTDGGRIELKDLDAREVSLVDSPAIVDKFVVIKNETGGGEMSDEDKKKDEETQGKEDEKNKDEETQADSKDEETKDEKTEDKDEETQAASPEVVGALKQIMSLTNKLMQMVGSSGGGAEPTAKSEDGESVETLMAQASFMLDELSEGRIPETAAVEKAGKRVTPTRLKKLETLQAELASLIKDLKGEAKKEETQSADEDKGKDKTEKSDGGDKLDKVLAEIGKVNKRLDKVEAGGSTSRGESEDEGDGGKQKTEKSDEGSMAGFFTGISG